MSPATTRLLSPRFVFIALSLLGLLAFSLSPLTRKWLGIFDGGQWFLDSFAVLAANDAHRVGIDPSAPNPYDVMFRTHKYSDWWFALGKMGLTREDSFLIGGLWVLSFLAVAFVTVRPTGYLEAIWMAALVSSPSVLLGVNRANNDLVVFTLLGLALVALRTDSNFRVGLAVALVALGTGLKFYPVVAVAAFILVRPERIIGVTAVATIVALAALVSVGSQIGRGSFGIDPNPHRMGAQMVFIDAGLSEARAPLVAGLVFLALIPIAMGLGWTKESGPTRDISDSRRMLTMGSVILIFCFLLGINAAYRWIFVLWTAPWLWAHRRVYLGARIAAILLPFCLWHDGILCLVINIWFRNLRPEQYKHIEVVWRATTEPFTWGLMILFAGWWLNSVWQSAQVLWTRGRGPVASTAERV